jgi:Ion transport protein
MILIFTAVTTPLQLAFSDSDNLTWTVINYIVDSIFLIDIVLSFFSAYEGEDEGELEHNHCKIALRYIKSWFFIDVMTIVPISEFL